MGFPIGPAISLVQFARSLNGPPLIDCPAATNSAGNTRPTPWRGAFPSPAELSAWYDAAEEMIAKAESTPWINLLDGGMVAVNELREQFDALPNRAVAYGTDAKSNALKAASLAQSALCLVHEANAVKKAKKSERPRDSEKPGWWDELKKWLGWPTVPGGAWSFPDFPDLPDVPSFPKIEPWMIAVAAGVLFMVVRQHPAARAIRRRRRR